MMIEADYEDNNKVLAILEQIKDPTKLFTGSEMLGRKVFCYDLNNVP